MSAAIRVTLRELRETAVRALSAAGASGGEAEAAATVVTRAELHEGTGLAALLTELAGVPVGQIAVTSRRETLPGHRLPVTVLDDPARRGPLLVGRLAVDLCAATDRTVSVPGHDPGSAFVWTAVEVAEHRRLGLELMAPDGTGAVVVTAGGALYRRPRPGSAEAPAECLIARAGPITPSDVAVSTTASRTNRRRAALEHGVEVDPSLWNRARTAAARFLVPEPRST